MTSGVTGRPAGVLFGFLNTATGNPWTASRPPTDFMVGGTCGDGDVSSPTGGAGVPGTTRIGAAIGLVNVVFTLLGTVLSMTPA